MKRYILNLLKFGIFATVFYIVAISLWSWMMPPFMAKNVRNCIGCYGHLNTRVKEISDYKNTDILFLGSSHAYRGFDTRIYEKHGLKTFNLGSSSQSPIQTYILLNQYVDDLNPKLVVLEVYAGTLGIDGVESSLDLAANNKIDFNYIKTLPDVPNILTYNTVIYGYFRQAFNLNESFKEDLKQAEDSYVKGGFVETEFRKNTMTDPKSSKWIIDPIQIKYLNKNISLLKQKNIQYLLVQTPITKTLYQSKTNNEEVDSLLKNLGNYKNFQGDLELNDSIDFYDSNHMNQPAVVKFNEHFIEYLRTINLIK